MMLTKYAYASLTTFLSLLGVAWLSGWMDRGGLRLADGSPAKLFQVLPMDSALGMALGLAGITAVLAVIMMAAYYFEKMCFAEEEPRMTQYPEDESELPGGEFNRERRRLHSERPWTQQRQPSVPGEASTQHTFLGKQPENGPRTIRTREQWSASERPSNSLTRNSASRVNQLQALRTNLSDHHREVLH